MIKFYNKILLIELAILILPIFIIWKLDVTFGAILLGMQLVKIISLYVIIIRNRKLSKTTPGDISTEEADKTIRHLQQRL